jgi:hypothetical protein
VVRPWTLAPCLVTLRAQVNAAFPNRSKASDGTIGDAAHAATKSEHNPDAQGVVRAFDITHDPAHGCDGNRLAAQLVTSRDSRILYVIWNRRIARSYPKPGIPAWSWAAYTGPDPHTNHVHLSVVPDARATDARPWRLIAATPQKEDDDMTPEQANTLNYHTAQLKDVATRVNGVAAAVRALAASTGPTVAAAVDEALDGFDDAVADRVISQLHTLDGYTDDQLREVVKSALREGTGP